MLFICPHICSWTKHQRGKHELWLVGKTAWSSVLTPTPPPTPALFTWWIYNDMTSMIIMRDRRRWTSQAGCKNTHCHHDPATSTLCFHLFASLSLSLSFFFLCCISDCITDSTPGSLSNSTGLLHHNRSPAVIAAFLPVTTARAEEGFLFHTPGPPKKQEVVQRHVPIHRGLVSSNPEHEANTSRKYKVPKHFFLCFITVFFYFIPEVGLHFPIYPLFCASIPQGWHQHR